MKKILLLMIAGTLLMYSCKQNGGGKLTVTGSYKNANKFFQPASGGKTAVKIYLVEVPFGKDQSPVAIDSVTLYGDDNHFRISAKGKKDIMYELVFGDNFYNIPLINDADEIKIDVDLANNDDAYEVSNSAATKTIRIFLEEFGNKRNAARKAFNDIDSLQKSTAPDSLLIAATSAKNHAMDDLNNYLKNFLRSANNGTVYAFALGWASESFSRDEFESALYGSIQKFPGNETLLQIKNEYETKKAIAQKQAEQSQQSLAASWIGKQAPDLALPDANGKIVSLSSFRGKYLLVDFWASWCGPCRAENPNVVKAYGEFRNKNFAILGVSLDQDKSAWQQAIREDNLGWQQVSDLKQWNSIAVNIFQFQGIPFNVLIDPQGKIIDQELRGSRLENKLKELLQ